MDNPVVLNIKKISDSFIEQIFIFQHNLFLCQRTEKNSAQIQMIIGSGVWLNDPPSDMYEWYAFNG